MIASGQSSTNNRQSATSCSKPSAITGMPFTGFPSPTDTAGIRSASYGHIRGSGSAGDGTSEMGTGGGGPGGSSSVAVWGDDDSHWGDMAGMGGLAVVKDACDESESFKNSVTPDIDIKEFLQEKAAAWQQSNPDGVTVVMADTAALPFQFGGGGSAADAVSRALKKTVSGIPGLATVVRSAPASVHSGCILRGTAATADGLPPAAASHQSCGTTSLTSVQPLQAIPVVTCNSLLSKLLHLRCLHLCLL
jgi:hypothetical protein